MNITHHIEANGLSRADICKAAGITKGFLSLIESGDRRVGVGKLSALAAALGVAPGDLRPDLAGIFA